MNRLRGRPSWLRGRRKYVAFAVLAVSAIAASQHAFAADGDPQPTNPTGFGDLLPTPDLTGGDTRTLFEHYGPMTYTLDADLSFRDPADAVFNSYANAVMMYIVAITRSAISVGWWLFSLTDVQALRDAAAGTIGLVGTELVGWLLPAALAFGAIAAYAQRKSSGSAMNQLLWVLAAALVSISFATSSATWMKGVDGARQLGSGAVMSATSATVGPTTQSPIPWPEPAFNGISRDTLLRKSADATWRSFTVTPWCVAEFGSLAACERYGKAILDRGTNQDARKKYIDDEISKAEGSGDAATVQWSKGKNAIGRIGIVSLSAIAATVFAFLNIALAFAALMAYIGCLLLMVVGVFFACLWVVPGRPRQWGMNWFEMMLGFLLQSVLAMLVFGTALSLLTGVFSVAGSMGWLTVTGLAIVVLIAGYQTRRMLGGLTTMMRPGSGSMMMGSAARKAATRFVGRLGSRLSSPTVGDSSRRRHRTGGDSDGSTQLGTRRQYRQVPRASASGGPATEAGGREFVVGAVRERSSTSPSTGTELGGGGTGGATGKPATPGLGRLRSGQASQGREIAIHALPVAASPGRRRDAQTRGSKRDSEERRIKLNGEEFSQSASRAKGGRKDGGRSGGGSTRPQNARRARYEPRQQVHSASLRDGPPKTLPQARRRRSAASPRQFRQYSGGAKRVVAVDTSAGR